MIVLTRIDYRLIHGQVAVAWSNYLSADAILVANDEVANDLFQKRIMNLAKPSGVKLIFKNIEESIDAINSGVTDKYRLFIVVKTIEDAYKLYQEVNSIEEINLGLSSRKENSKNIANSVYVDEKEEKLLLEMAKNNVFINVKQSPADVDRDFTNLI